MYPHILTDCFPLFAGSHQNPYKDSLLGRSRGHECPSVQDLQVIGVMAFLVQREDDTATSGRRRVLKWPPELGRHGPEFVHSRVASMVVFFPRMPVVENFVSSF